MKVRLPVKQRQEIGERVRQVRKANGLEQTEMAERFGLSQAIISQYEKGLTEISLAFVFHLQGLGASPNWLLTGEGKVDDAVAINLGGSHKRLLNILAGELRRLEESRKAIKAITKEAKALYKRPKKRKGK